MLFVLPIPMIYNLHMPLKMKIGAIVVFGIGSMYVDVFHVRCDSWLTIIQHHCDVCCTPGISTYVVTKYRSLVGCCAGRHLDVSCNRSTSFSFTPIIGR
jgi:hypothetical protein